jgi:heptosyltransferase-3
LPALWAVRRHFRDAHLTLLCNRRGGNSHVLAADLLEGTGVFDELALYPEERGNGRAAWLLHMAKLLVQLRRDRYDTLVYLAPSGRSREQIERDRRFFSAAGIREFSGMTGFPALPVKQPGRPLDSMPSEADLLLARLAADGIAVPGPGSGSVELKLGSREEAEVRAWLGKLPTDGGRPWIGLGPGSMMPAKRWPEQRFQTAVGELINEFDFWPVVFGGTEDAAMAARLVGKWGRGYNAAGGLSVRAAAAALKRCTIYLGNDTGTMHLAAAVGTPCVAVFSARAHPGLWYPYGSESRVLRAEVECEGCGLEECVQRQNRCLELIDTQSVLRACRDVIKNRLSSPLPRPANVDRHYCCRA